MKGRRVSLALGLFTLALFGCAKPAQLGGLGVFNPNGLEGRMALAGRVKAPVAAAPEKHPLADIESRDQATRSPSGPGRNGHGSAK